MMYGRRILSALLLAGSLLSSTAFAQDVVMRRPLPRSAPLTQANCVQGEPDCPPTVPPACPVGHVCTPPITNGPITPAEAGAAYGWYLTCEPPELAECETVILNPDGSFDYDVAPAGACNVPQSAEKNAIIEAEGFDLIPGVFHDFTALCAAADQPQPSNDPDVPGLRTDPAGLETGAENDPIGTVGHTWEVGPWLGTAQCGQQSSLTRAVRCVALSLDIVIGSSDAPREPGQSMMRQASFGKRSAEGSLAPAVFVPGDGDVSLIEAQFNPNDPMLRRTPVVPSRCVSEVGPAPSNAYTGDRAGCSYTPEESLGQWTNPFGGSVTCSADAQRTRTIRCLDQNSQEVSPKYCTLALSSGGQEDTGALEPERGNFSGCTAAWQDQGFDVGCKPTGSPFSSQGGPTRYFNSNFVCVRSDGTTLTGIQEASCSPNDRGTDGLHVSGTCVRTFYAFAGGACLGPKVVKFEVANPNGALDRGGADSCVGAGATCCQVQSADYNNGFGRIFQVVGTAGPVSSRFGEYYDHDGVAICYGSNVTLPDGTVNIDWCNNGNDAEGNPIFGPCSPSTAFQCPTEGANRISSGGSGIQWKPAP